MPLFPQPIAFSLLFQPLSTQVPLFTHKEAFSLTFLSLSILTRRCSDIQSHFHSYFTPLAFLHTAVLAHNRIFPAFSPAQHSPTHLFSHTIAFSLFLSFLKNAGIQSYERVFASFGPMCDSPRCCSRNYHIFTANVCYCSVAEFSHHY